MRARYRMVDTMLENFGGPGPNGYVDVVQEALDHFLDMLRLCRSDNMGVRDRVPGLYIRLNKDQAAYDFMKWWATTGNESDYDWGNMDLPFLDLKNADALEPPLDAWANNQFLSLSHVAAVLLIKIRILLDLQAAQNTTRAFKGTVPPEIIELIRGQLVGSIVGSRVDILMGSVEELANVIQTVKDQVISLYESINSYNPHFWHMMLHDPYVAAAQMPDAYSMGTGEEACLTIRNCLGSWVETPGAFEMIETLSSTAV